MSSRIVIENYNRIIPSSNYINLYPEVMQWPFRCLVFSASGSGKTNVVMNLLHK